MELYDHIDDDDMKKVAEAVEQKQKWMTSKMQSFSKIAKHDEPPVLVAQIVSEKEVGSAVLSLFESLTDVVLYCLELRANVQSYSDKAKAKGRASKRRQERRRRLF